MSNVKQTVAISRKELATILADLNHVTFTSMKCVTPIKMNKYDKYWNVDATTGKKTKNPNAEVNPYFDKGIFKYAYKYKIITGFDYVASVIRRLEDEGKDESEYQRGESWHKQISKALVCSKNDENKLYFRYQYLEDSTVLKEYYFDGQPIEKEAFSRFVLPPSDYKNQGLDKTLNFQVVDLENILEITLGGVHYSIIL